LNKQFLDDLTNEIEAIKTIIHSLVADIGWQTTPVVL
jgi:hypothetical protein